MVLKNWLQLTTTVSNVFFSCVCVREEYVLIDRALEYHFFLMGKKKELLIKLHCDDYDVRCIPLVVVRYSVGGFLHIVHAVYIPFGASH